jgi:hypothetical protein
LGARMQRERMFGTPVKQKDSRSGADCYDVPLTRSIRLGVRITSAGGHLIPNRESMSKLAELRKTVLRELVKERRLFKHAPSLESLEMITPMWGFVLVDGAPQLSPYTVFLPMVDRATHSDCIVDLELEQLEISRSTICPVFRILFVEAVAPTAIEFEWGVDADAAAGDEDEIEEVSDVALDAEDDGAAVRLMDPAVREREKEEAKARIRAAFLAAEEARTTAEELAARFHEAYDLSDSESAFSEWIGSDSESEA